MPPDFEGAKKYALGRLERELDPALTYHNLWHTRDEVLPGARRLAAMMGADGRDLGLIELGAVFHDIGFVVTMDGHESAGAEIAGRVLPSFCLSPADVAAVQSMILATKLPQSPRGLLEEIVADADLDSLGRRDFVPRSLALRTELTARGMSFTDEEWYARQLRFLESHRFFTAAARSSRSEGECGNTDLVRRLLAEAQRMGDPSERQGQQAAPPAQLYREPRTPSSTSRASGTNPKKRSSLSQA